MAIRAPDGANKHSHPLIYMKGMKYVELVSIVDFLYYGEANVFQEDLDLLLSIAEELELKGFECSQMPIFCVKSVKIYTGQKTFTRIYPWDP